VQSHIIAHQSKQKYNYHRKRGTFPSAITKLTS